jgi:ABC-type nitrate/sulfonate/bicarbonate transport system substrate-binding protein
MIDRRLFLASASAAAALGAAASAPARAAVTVTTQLQWIKDVQNAAWWVADANGYFRDAGIDSNVLAGGPNLASAEAVVAAGRADVGFDQLEKIIDANNEGEDFVVFGALYQQDPAALLSLPKNPVRSAHDILGKRLGLQQGARLYIDAIMKVNHLPPNYSEIVVGFDPEPLVEGACDAYLCFITNQPLTLAARNVPYVTATFDQLGYETYTDALFCTRDYLSKNRDTLVRYVHALQRGWATNAHDPVLAAHLAVTVYGAALGLDEKQQIGVNRAQIPLMENAATRANGRTKLPPVDRLIDTSILRDAAKLR